MQQKSIKNDRDLCTFALFCNTWVLIYEPIRLVDEGKAARMPCKAVTFCRVLPWDARGGHPAKKRSWLFGECIGRLTACKMQLFQKNALQMENVLLGFNID